MNFTRAIVRPPGRSIIRGLSRRHGAPPRYEKACRQHAGYVAALEECGLAVTGLEPLEAYPDSTFVEDTAVLLPDCAILTAPGAPSRKGETDAMAPVLERFYQRIERIEPPATLEGGDVLRVGNRYFIGLSGRTNRAGADRFAAIVAEYGYACTRVRVENLLHLKTGVTCVDDPDILIAGPGFTPHPVFSGYRVIAVPQEEAAAANCIAVNGRVLMPAGYPRTRKLIEEKGMRVIEVDISEFARIDGGLTCLSLRF